MRLVVFTCFCFSDHQNRNAGVESASELYPTYIQISFLISIYKNRNAGAIDTGVSTADIPVVKTFLFNTFFAVFGILLMTIVLLEY